MEQELRKTELIIGKNHKFRDLSRAILDKLTAIEAKMLLIVIEDQMKEPRFLKQEAKWQALVKRIQDEKEAKKK